MSAAQRDIEIPRGDGYRHKLEFVRPVGDATEAIDITGWVVSSSVRDWWDGLVSEDFAVDEVASDRVTGVLWITLTETQTANSALPSRSVWDVQYTTPADTYPTTFLRGNVRLLGQATA